MNTNLNDLCGVINDFNYTLFQYKSDAFGTGGWLNNDDIYYTLLDVIAKAEVICSNIQKEIKENGGALNANSSLSNALKLLSSKLKKISQNTLEAPKRSGKPNFNQLNLVSGTVYLSDLAEEISKLSRDSLIYSYVCVNHTNESLFLLGHKFDQNSLVSTRNFFSELINLVLTFNVQSDLKSLENS